VEDEARALEDRQATRVCVAMGGCGAFGAGARLSDKAVACSFRQQLLAMLGRKLGRHVEVDHHGDLSWGGQVLGVVGVVANAQ
jgi:hypothetical protein